MKKASKIFLPFLSLVLPITVGLSSCTINFSGGIDYSRQINDEHYNYINQRTVSITAGIVMNDGRIYSRTYGTAWFYDKYTVSGSNNYTFELLTNFHVYYGMQQVFSLLSQDPTHSIFSFAYVGILANDYNDGEVKNQDNDDYVEVFRSTTYEGFETNMPAFVATFTLQISPWTTITAQMDMAGIKLDLTKVMNATKTIGNKNKPEDFANKINGINKIYQDSTDHKILHFASDRITKNKSVYMAGYPWATANEDRDFTYFCEWTDKIIECLEPRLMNLDGFFAYEETNYLNWYSNYPLGPGASGSLTIDEDYNVVGIYWGGSQSQLTTDFSPSFANFILANSPSDFNFITTLDSTINAH